MGNLLWVGWVAEKYGGKQLGAPDYVIWVNLKRGKRKKYQDWQSLKWGWVKLPFATIFENLGVLETLL